jgi:predicted nucleic acid-binding protein
LILVDTSVWIDHFRTPVAALEHLILAEQAMCHPFIRGELAVGHLRNWLEAIGALQSLPQAKTASEGEFLALIVNEQLATTGLGFVDVHLLASCRATPGTKLWSRDKRLAKNADRLGVGWTDAQ